MDKETSGRSLSYCSNQAVLRAASEGPVEAVIEAVVSASPASISFLTLEGVAPSLELPAMALLPHFSESMGDLDFGTPTRQFLLGSRPAGLVRVGIRILSDLLLDLLTGL